MIHCLHCRAETSNGLALCDLCRRKASTILEYLPIYFHNLARWRPGRAGARPVPGSRVLYDGSLPNVGTGDRISDTLDETATALTTWARTLIDDRPHYTRPFTRYDAALMGELVDEPADHLALVIAGLSEAFGHHLTSIATLDWCGEFVRDLSEHEARLRAFTEQYVPGWYAGGCARCDSGIYVTPGLTWVTCAGCGTTTHVGDHREVILDEARGWVARPKALAEAIVALVDHEMSVPKVYTRIRQWAHQDDIESIRRYQRGYIWSDEHERVVLGVEEVGHARYRLGDVLDMVMTRRDTPVASRPAAS